MLRHLSSPPAAGRSAGAGCSRSSIGGAPEESQQLIGIAGAVERGVCRDRPALHQIGERLLHRLHAARRSGLHHRVDLLELPLADQVPDGVVGEHDLQRGDAALAVGRRQQRLGDDAFEASRELGADLGLLLGGEDIDDAVDRPGRARACGAWRRRGGRSRRRSARSRSSRGRASRRGGSRRGLGGGLRRSASAKPCASVPISRWLTRQLRWLWRNSIGSSIVRM